MTQHAFLDESVDSESKRTSVAFCISGKRAHVSGERKTAAEEIEEHEICNIGKLVRVGGKSKVSVEFDGSNTSQRVVLCRCARTDL